MDSAISKSSLDWSGQRSCPPQTASRVLLSFPPCCFSANRVPRPPSFIGSRFFRSGRGNANSVGKVGRARAIALSPTLFRIPPVDPSRAFPNFSARASWDRLRWPPSSFPSPPSLIIPLFPYFFVRGTERDVRGFVQRNRIVVGVNSRSTWSWKRIEIEKEENLSREIIREGEYFENRDSTKQSFDRSIGLLESSIRNCQRLPVYFPSAKREKERRIFLLE